MGRRNANSPTNAKPFSLAVTIKQILMNKKIIKNFGDYLNHIDSISSLTNSITLFRGQSNKQELLPTIARQDPKIDTTNLEKQMLEEFRRRTQLIIKDGFTDDWELLIFAQHFGLKTRLLDWTSNPLTGLWFACSNEYNAKQDGFVYVLNGDSSLLVDRKQETNPFDRNKTRILRPSLNNERILAQSGWFTAHKYSNSSKRWVKLETNLDITSYLTELTIPSSQKGEILKKLSIFGINAQSLFPDITGVCNHLNWMYQTSLK